jgi:hypothetical protein
LRGYWQPVNVAVGLHIFLEKIGSVSNARRIRVSGQTNTGKTSIDKEGIERLWQYRLQQENIFYQRLNFFLVAESMLLVAFTTILSKVDFWNTTISVGILGLLLTFLWGAVNIRQYQVYNHVRKLVEEVCPEFKDLRAIRPKSFVRSWFLLTYIVPALIAIAWTVLLLMAVVDRK